MPGSGHVRRDASSRRRGAPCGRRAPPGPRRCQVCRRRAFRRLVPLRREIASHLETARAGEAMQAHLVAGRIALSRGSLTQAEPHLERAAQVPPPRTAAAAERGLAGPGPAGRRAGQRQGHCRRVRPRARCPRGASDAARCHRVARVRHGPRCRARDAGPARRASAGRCPSAAVLERAAAGDRAGRPEHTAPWTTRS